MTYYVKEVVGKVVLWLRSECNQAHSFLAQLATKVYTVELLHRLKSLSKPGSLLTRFEQACCLLVCNDNYTTTHNTVLMETRFDQVFFSSSLYLDMFIIT